MHKFLYASLAFLCINVSGAVQTLDVKNSQDAVRVLNNPDKGWYHHYYDNCLEKYLGDEKDIEKIPNLNHLFLRFAWCFLEPEEGKFNWALIDDQVEKWSKKGVNISLSITAQETGAQYATPKWVVDAGAKGAMYNAYGSRDVWEPDYDDPIFLQKLENLQKAIAKRYDGKDFIATITIASIGNWGEGHNGITSKKVVPFAVIKKHIDIYKKYFKKSQIVIGDDYLGNLKGDERQNMLDYLKQNKISCRDDSILVHWSYRHNPSKFSLLNPDLFSMAAEYAPTTLEMEHYGIMKKKGEWVGKNGSEFGADVVREVIKRSQCTYIGFHGYAKEFLADNPDYANEIANKVGYWFFINSVSYNQDASTLEVEWDNRGVARAYEHYRVYFRIKSSDGKFEKSVRAKDADPRKFMPGITKEIYIIDFADAPKGKYELSVKMKTRGKPSRNVELGFKESLRDADGFYKLGEIEIR